MHNTFHWLSAGNSLRGPVHIAIHNLHIRVNTPDIYYVGLSSP